jgi:hypothetical protein
MHFSTFTLLMFFFLRCSGLAASVASSSSLLLAGAKSQAAAAADTFFTHSDALASAAYFNRMQSKYDETIRIMRKNSESNSKYDHRNDSNPDFRNHQHCCESPFESSVVPVFRVTHAGH